MARMNGLHPSKANQVSASILIVILIALLVALILNRGPWWAVGALALLIAFGGVVFFFARKPER